MALLLLDYAKALFDIAAIIAVQSLMLVQVAFGYYRLKGDVPDGVTAAPQCVLQDASSGSKYCALMCSPSLPIADQAAADGQCPENASCKPAASGIGICTYDD